MGPEPHQPHAVDRPHRRPTPPPPSHPIPAPIGEAELADVLGVARRLAGRRSPLLEDFEEAAVDGLLAAVRSHSRASCPFRAWARSCARRKILERSRYLRAAKRGAGRVEALDFEPGFTDADRDEPSFAELVGPLAAADRELLYLRFESGWNYNRIAAQFRVSERSVRRRILRSLARLKTIQGAA